ncbi:MAG: nuclear transport factor 2 family protein, partial [Rhizobiaceae bacterium]
DYLDPDKVLEHCHDELDWWVPGDTKMSCHRDRAAMRKMIEGLAGFSDSGMPFRPTGFIIEGNRAAVEAWSSVSFRDGREYRNEYHLLVEFKDGKIWKVKQYFDTKKVADLFGG